MAFAPTIHSIGDAQFLSQVLNAVAMIIGTNDFVQLVSIGLLLGAIIVVLQGLFRGAREIPWHQLLLGWILYACMFVPTTTVIVEDAYTGKAYSVDNVPIGVAFAGSMISNVGYGITNLFETAYGDVRGISEGTFAEPLVILNAVRQHASDVRVLQELDKSIGQGTDIQKTLHNYIKECTLPKLALSITTPTELVTGDMMEELKFESSIYGTRSYIENPSGENLTCAEAWKKIEPALEKIKDPKFINQLSTAANLKGEAGDRAMIDDYQAAFDMLNINGTAVEEFMLASTIKPIYEKAVSGYYRNLGDKTSAIMFNQAVQQRNTQWAAEASMFMTVVRPFLSFFEGFMYSITPVLAFLLVLGGIGISLGVKYILLILWIQLWMPVLSICNLYIIMSARGELAAQTFTSFYSVDKLGQSLEHWMATGGMLASATPLISLFLITGSTFAFTSLTQRMAGGDHINEKIPTPDIMRQGEFYAHGTAGNGNSFLGAIRTGTEGTEGTINFDKMRSEARQSALTEAQAATNVLNNGYSTNYSSATTAADQAAISREIGSRMMASGSSAVQSLESGIRQTSWGKNLSKEQMSQVIDTVSAGISAGWSTPEIFRRIGLSFGAKTASGTSENDTSQKGLAINEEDRKALQNTFQTTNSSDLSKAREAALTETDSRTFLNNAGVSENSQVGRTVQNAIEKTQNYQKTMSATESLGFTGTWTTRQVTGMLKNENGEAVMGQIANAYQGTAIDREAEAVSQRLQKENGMNKANARVAGFITALGKSGDYRDQQNLRSLLGTATGMNFSPMSDPDQNKGIAGNVENASEDGLRNEAQLKERALAAEKSVPKEQTEIANKLGSTPDSIDRAENTVRKASVGFTMGAKDNPQDGVLGNQVRLNENHNAKDIMKARDNLKGLPQDVAAIPRSFFNNQQEAVARCVKAGLTDGQTMYLSRRLMGAYGSLKNAGYQALYDENERLYGQGTQSNMSKEELTALTNDMVANLDHAARGGELFEAGLGNVTEWNKANTAFGANPNEETANRIKRLDETLGRKPSDHLTPEEKAQHNRYRGLEGKGTD